MGISEYERVYTVTNYWDCPRKGVADFKGRPHVYEAQFDEETDEYTDTFLLSPVSKHLFEAALESWDIWLRWDAAFERGLTTRETHPALAADRARHEELDRILATLKVDPNDSKKAHGEFRVSLDRPAQRWNNLEVKWTEISETPETDT